MYIEPGQAARAYLYTIPHSHAGIEATVRHMRRIGREGATRPEVQRWAHAIVGDAAGWEAAQRIRSFLAERVRFRFDPPGVELVRTPSYMLWELETSGRAEGDCDDVAVLGAALGMAAGLSGRYVLVALTPGDPFEHVYTELVTPAGPVELDTTRPAQMPPGVKVYRTGTREA